MHRHIIGLFCCAVVMVFLTWNSLVLAEALAPIAIVKNVKGTVNVDRGAESVPVVKGFVLLQNDIVVTGSGASVGVIFKDNSVLSMGPNSRLEIQDFTFEPAEKKLSFVAKVVHGTVTYLSGIIAKLSPESVEFWTPSATIGIRGTHIGIQVDKG